MVKELRAEGELVSLLGNIIKETRELMQRFKSCKIHHIGCLGNEIAHRLAKYA